jgi:hypothetical protein
MVSCEVWRPSGGSRNADGHAPFGTRDRDRFRVDRRAPRRTGRGAPVTGLLAGRRILVTGAASGIRAAAIEVGLGDRPGQPSSEGSVR